MYRTDIMLREDQYAFLRELAWERAMKRQARRVSVSAIIRELVDEYRRRLEDEERVHDDQD